MLFRVILENSDDSSVDDEIMKSRGASRPSSPVRLLDKTARRTSGSAGWPRQVKRRSRKSSEGSSSSRNLPAKRHKGKGTRILCFLILPLFFIFIKLLSVPVLNCTSQPLVLGAVFCVSEISVGSILVQCFGSGLFPGSGSVIFFLSPDPDRPKIRIHRAGCT